MILQIVIPLGSSVGVAATLKQDLCVSPMGPSFKLDLSPGEAEKKSVDFGVLSNHSPPTDKGRMFGMRPRDPSPSGE